MGFITQGQDCSTATQDPFSMTKLADKMPPPIHVSIELKDYDEIAVVPWFSFRSSMPESPLPPLEDRPNIKTDRLSIRPFTPDDLDALYELRQISEIQLHSKVRGRPDRSKDETAASIEALIEHQDDHWYFGAFLRSTGELIGEGGLPSCRILHTSNSGWPEAEFLIKPQYWRQGYGTELFTALMESYWNLPRQWRRLQILPVLVPDLDPGSDIEESVVFQWEAHNERAPLFFAKLLNQMPTSASGFLESRDMRDGKEEGSTVKWVGMAVKNPKPVPKPDVENDD